MTGPDVLCDPERMRALLDTGLTAAPDPAMDRIAAQVRRWLAVPVALVTLVQPDQQVFPGMTGLPEPWASRRATPLTHSFCRHVVRTGEALVVTDARTDPRVLDNLAVPDLGVLAYAGIPLTDDDGNVLGSLCAIDTRPRTWTDADLDLLADLAGHCSTALRLRLARRDHALEERRRDGVETGMNAALDRGRTLLLASQAFTATTTVADVRARVHQLATDDLATTRVAVFLLDDARRTVRRLAAVPGSPVADPSLRRWLEFPVTERLPPATAIREDRIVHHPDRAGFDAAHPPSAAALLRVLGLHTVVAVPLPGPDGPVGAIELGWDRPRRFDAADLVVITTIAGYAAQALGRARHLAHRVDVAYELQQAMLTTLPSVDGLDIGAHYLPADTREHVGGDWYDAISPPDPAHPDRRTVVVTVGDIVGHALHAATIMGQTRSMLRQAACDHPGGPPSRIFTAFEDANHAVGLDAAGTAVLAQLTRHPGQDGWTMRWTNAGHPPPILITPDGHAELLDDHDATFGYRHLGIPGRARRDHHRDIPPGSLLVVYTDGLVERRDRDIDAGIAALLDLLRDIHTARPGDISTTLTTRLAPHAADDVAVLAVRF